MIRSIIKRKFVNICSSIYNISSLNNFMLRKVGRKRARVPLTREGENFSLLHADGWVGVDEVCGLACFQPCFGYRGFRCWFRLQASRISPAFVRVSLLTTAGVRGVFSRPLHRRRIRNPHQIVSVTGRGAVEDHYIGMSDIKFSCQPKLDECKVKT